MCSGRAARAGDVPMARIEGRLHLSDAQVAALRELKDAIAHCSGVSTSLIVGKSVTPCGMPRCSGTIAVSGVVVTFRLLGSQIGRDSALLITGELLCTG